jgi:homoserine O-acetyltransferase
MAIPADFRLESGQCLPGHVHACLHGPDTGPLVVVAGGISSGRYPAEDAAGAPGWWPWVVRHGGPIDLNSLRVLAFDYPPGREDGAVTITTTDQARLLALLLDQLHEARIDAFVGASYGGAVALAFAAAFPDRLKRLVVISAAHRTHPLITAWRGIQRRILALAKDAGREAEGVALARELAMTTYRTAEEFALRFDPTPPPLAGQPYPVCDYLAARSRDYAAVMSADRWVALSDSLDRHAVAPEAIRAPLTLIGFTSDRLAPIEDLRDLAARAPQLERLIEAPSIFGHDAFLKERDLIGRALHTALSPLNTAQACEIAA